MHAIVQHGSGGPEVLSFEEVPTPEPGPGEVLIDVTASGVNRADLLQRQGFYPPPPGASELIGLECSGTIAGRGEDVGGGVNGFEIGDPVVALLAGGGYAEFVVVPVGQVVRAPRGMDLVTAGGVMETAATVWSNMDAAGLRRDDTLLVHGGSGGIGAFAIQYAKAVGAAVICTAGSEEKLAYCRELGADHALDYHGDWSQQVADLGGADVILDNMGAKYLEPNIAALKTGGRLLTIGMQGGTKGTLDFSQLMAKRGWVTAISLRSRPADEKAAICAKVASLVWPLFEQGRIVTPRETRIPLADAARAHTQLESGDNVGKIVLTTG